MKTYLKTLFTINQLAHAGFGAWFLTLFPLYHRTYLEGVIVVCLLAVTKEFGIELPIGVDPTAWHSLADVTGWVVGIGLGTVPILLSR